MLSGKDQDMINIIVEKLNGTDPIAEANKRLGDMSADELRKMVLLACNRIGYYKSSEDRIITMDEAILYFIQGITEVFEAYDKATQVITDLKVN